jgi:hypothetical protein
MDNLSCGNLWPPRLSEVQVAAGCPAHFASVFFLFRYDADSHSGNRWFPIGITRNMQWRLAVAAVGIGVATGVLFHSRSLDLQVIPFVAWPLLVAG